MISRPFSFSPGIYLAAFFLFVVFAAHAQVKRCVSPLDAAYLSCDPVGWHNWIIGHKSTIQADSNLIVYYDSNFTHKGLERILYADGRSAWTGYYLNGQRMSTHTYRTSDSSWTETRFTLRGDTVSTDAGQHSYNVYCRKQWSEDQWNPGRRYVSQLNRGDGKGHFICTFDANGDTLSVCESIGRNLARPCWNTVNGKRVITQVQDSSGKVTNVHVDYSKPEHRYRLILSVKDSLKLDSLGHYPNLREVTVQLDNATPGFLRRLRKLSGVPGLEMLTVMGGSTTAFPAFILRCTQVKELKLQGTQVKLIPPSVAALKNLRSIHLENNPQLDLEASLQNLAAVGSLRRLILPLDNGRPLPRNVALLKGLYYLSIGSYGICTRDTSPDLRMDVIYKLRELRRLVVCTDQFYKIDPFEFAKRMPGCYLTQYETCFAPGAEIRMADGSVKTIGQVRAGDLVLSFDSANGRFDTSVVERIFLHEEPMEGLLDLEIVTEDGEALSLTTTSIHPFYSEGKWKNAVDLKPGDPLLCRAADGQMQQARVVSLEHRSGKNGKVHNIRTSKHTFIVNGIIVHNK
jgi:hypothetical protein